MKKAIIAFTVGMTTLGLTGCAGMHWECNAKKGESGKAEGGCKVGGKFYTQQASKFLRPIANLLAETGYYTFEDWNSLDVSKFELQIAESETNTVIENNQVKVTALDGESSLGAKLFSVVKVNGKYKFSNPSEVKEWSYNFVDVADNVEVDFDMVSTGSNGESATLIATESGQVRASTTWVPVTKISGGTGWEMEK